MQSFPFTSSSDRPATIVPWSVWCWTAAVFASWAHFKAQGPFVKMQIQISPILIEFQEILRQEHIEFGELRRLFDCR